MNKYKIVADSSCNLISFEGIPFETTPLKIYTKEREFVDNKDLDVNEMIDYLLTYNGESKTSCPSIQEYMDAFEDSENVFVITISSNLSGSYNAAVMASKQYKEEYPNRNIHVFDSLSTGAEMKLIIEHLKENVDKGLSFEENVKDTITYQSHIGLIFILSSMRNLANNGRCSHLAAKFAGVLGIRGIGKASEQGTIEMIDKVRGEAKTVDAIVNHIKNLGFDGRKIIIEHALAKEFAEKVKEKALEKFKDAVVTVEECRGLCSFYAEKGGLIIGFTK